MSFTDRLITAYSEVQFPGLEGRYLPLDRLKDVFKLLLALGARKETIGTSAEGLPIDLFTLGKGPVKVLMWSQMHGNESTTTRALADLFQFLQHDPEFYRFLSDKLTLYIIPMLNPDGAGAYTRLNANEVDLNRDAQNLSQPESKALRKAFNKAAPDFCLNLHDQRTIFSAGINELPATVSFLSPSYNVACDINEVRRCSMKVISIMNQLLQKLIPGQVGRYDDAFNLNCVGDTFQKEGVPTILFESGHYPDDYTRSETRKFIAFSISTALESIAEDSWRLADEQEYFKIPENEKLFCDLLIKKVPLKQVGGELQYKDLCYLYRETLKDGRVEFIPDFETPADSGAKYGHRCFEIPDHFILEYSDDQDLREKSMQLLSRVLS